MPQEVLERPARYRRVATLDVTKRESDIRAETKCEVKHQYNGNEICGALCTQYRPHDPPHTCSNGHSWGE